MFVSSVFLMLKTQWNFPYLAVASQAMLRLLTRSSFTTFRRIGKIAKSEY
jgi:hypothetical protein